MIIAVPDLIPAASSLRRVHFIGVGGAGLSAIARLMAAQGVRVSGSDAADSDRLRALAAEGIECHVGHDAAHVAGAEVVIASTAVREDNPEVRATLAAQIPLWPRSAGMRSLMVGRRTIAVAGTHGKTTTTAMLTCALRAAGLDPTFAIGADVPVLGANAGLGGDLFVAEADESDGAFLVYRPAGAVVTNVGADHLDIWGTPEAYAAAFGDFVASVGEFVVLGADDPGSRALAGAAHAAGLDVVLAGLDSDADFRADEVEVSQAGTTFTAWHDGQRRVSVQLRVPGVHYAADAIVALAAGVRLGADLPALCAGLADYTGAQRRMQYLGTAGGVRVYDSYAHHPTEIAADIAAARAIAGPARLVVAFQPHLFSRTRALGAQMGQALSAADAVVVADIYAAREAPDGGIDASLVADAVAGPPVVLGGPTGDLAGVLAASVRSGDLLVTLGAGDITDVGPQLLELLADQVAR